MLEGRHIVILGGSSGIGFAVAEAAIAAGATVRIGSTNADKIEAAALRSEEHTSELQSLMRISYAVFCLKKKNKQQYKLLPAINKNDTNEHRQRHPVTQKADDRA